MNIFYVREIVKKIWSVSFCFFILGNYILVTKFFFYYLSIFGGIFRTIEMKWMKKIDGSCFFIPQPLRLWGIVITRVRRAVRKSAPSKKLTDQFCLFFTYTTYVPAQFIPFIFFWHQAISGHFPRWPPKKLVGTITYQPLAGLHSNLVWLFSRYF